VETVEYCKELSSYLYDSLIIELIAV